MRVFHWVLWVRQSLVTWTCPTYCRIFSLPRLHPINTSGAPQTLGQPKESPLISTSIPFTPSPQWEPGQFHPWALIVCLPVSIRTKRAFSCSLLNLQWLAHIRCSTNTFEWMNTIQYRICYGDGAIGVLGRLILLNIYIIKIHSH